MANIAKSNNNNGTSALAQSTAKAVNSMLEKNRAAIMRTLPAGCNYDRMTRTVINAINSTPNIAKCSPSSIFLACVRAFSLGLEPNGVSSLAYLVPFNNFHKGTMEAQFMPSYKGLLDLCRRTGKLASIKAQEVCDNDDFVYDALNGIQKHSIDLRKPRGEAYAYWASAKLDNGEVVQVVMGREEIEKVRNASKAANSGPWVEWYDEMAKKTVIKRLLKLLPASVEMEAACVADNKAQGFDENTPSDIIDIEGLTIDEDEPTEQKPTSLKEKLMGKQEMPKPSEVECDENGVPKIDMEAER